MTPTEAIKTDYVSDAEVVRASPRRRAHEPIDHERRGAPRFPAVENQVWLGWWENRHRFEMTTARVINISRTGALARADSPPPQERPVWLCLGIPTPVAFVRVAVLALARDRSDRYAVRMSFCDPIPADMFHALVEGPWPEVPDARTESS